MHDFKLLSHNIVQCIFSVTLAQNCVGLRLLASKCITASPSLHVCVPVFLCLCVCACLCLFLRVCICGYSPSRTKILFFCFRIGWWSFKHKKYYSNQNYYSKKPALLVFDPAKCDVFRVEASPLGKILFWSGCKHWARFCFGRGVSFGQLFFWDRPDVLFFREG